MFKKLFSKILCFFQILCGFVIFYGNRWKIFFLEVATLLTIKFPTKCVFQPSRSKSVGEDTFLAAET